MRTVFMGTPDFAVNTLEAILAAGHEVAAVVTQPDKPKGRGKDLGQSPVKECAIAHGLTVYQPVKVREPEFVELLRNLAPEVIVVVAFGQILPKSILELPKYGCINVHASLLPKYRGAAPIQWAVIDGEKESGVAIQQMDEGLDTGDILMMVKTPLAPDETGGSLFDRLAVMGAKALTDTLAGLEAGTIRPVPQQGESNYAGKLDKTLGHMDFKKSADELERLIRGLNPWPSAYTALDGKTLKLWKAAVAEDGDGRKPGEIFAVTRHSFRIQTGKGSLEILELQLEGKKRMDTESFLRGYRLEDGMECDG